ncbi:MAG: PARP-type zinc finger-containing protein, partial [Candidatus Rokuibacteriota bacterium]
MPHVFETASSGRAKCRGCAQPIAKGDLRFGERLPNPFGEGEMTLWFHPICAAYKRPEPILEALGEAAEKPPESEALERAARANS